MWGALSDERICLSLTVAAGPRQRSISRVWVSRASWLYFTMSNLRLLQPGGSGSRICIPRDMVAQLYFLMCISFFVSFYDSQVCGVGTRNHFHMLELNLSYNRRSLGQSMLVSGSHQEPITIVFFWHLRDPWIGTGPTSWTLCSQDINTLGIFPVEMSTRPCTYSSSLLDRRGNSSPATTLANLDGCGYPLGDLSRRGFNLMDEMLTNKQTNSVAP
jgi:hypothetical protein